MDMQSLLDELEEKLEEVRAASAQQKERDEVPIMQEAERLREAQRQVHNEYMELRKHPERIISGPFYFISSNGVRFMIQIVNGQVSLAQLNTAEGIAEITTPVRAEQFFAKVTA